MSSLQKELFKKRNAAEETNEQNENDDLAPLQSPSLFKRGQPSAKYAPVSWDKYFDTYQDLIYVFRVYRINGSANANTPVFIFHHGAGHSALSFALTASHIREMTDGECSIVALDARGHGDTQTSNDTDYSLNTLSDDLVNVIQALYNGQETTPDLCLVGHSMGGSVVVDVASRKRLKNVVGVCVLDVVEGSAMDALSSMTSILNTRPQRFKNIEQAIQWSVRSNTVRNLESAKVSVPPLVRSTDDNALGWRTDLIKTKPFWTEWFTDLSSKFLACPAAKLLILAGTDRLDKPLMIGQMQGKFQLHIIPEAGHFLQEDAPVNTARSLVEFWRRNKRLVLPPKVQIK
ncbi:hypothetical protein O0I10_011328 [Lichtheimia ornata]|uniref:Protein phosphatase methylesterase 1 n=1 Tax=Lichtheimia ornata TaxID=688661 RepID=A0AAD7UT34_9FUNG|nr:uncharacterized protein O0I10_011328 [Lichtheimia ornata]KAJ8653028.1 hypothetical protein O0I10_011328 [Lichtheimia ornata]